MTSDENARKPVYAALWVDDAGSAPFPKTSIDWYHENAGPISFAAEIDDRYPWAFSRLLADGSVNPAFDYISHHHHSIRWSGDRHIKWIYDVTNLHWRLYALLQFLGLPGVLPTQLRLGTIGVASALFASAYLVYPYDVRLSAFLLVALFVLASMAFTWYYVRLSRNWTTMLLDTDWNKEFLRRVKDIFRKKGFEYPAAIRHGWGIPLPRMMKFYMKELGVIADYSPTPTERDHRAFVDDITVEWTNAAPYYASVSRGYEVEWNGQDEEDRGLLMIPLILGNIAFYGFEKAEKRVIQQTPERQLVCSYIHPTDDFRNIVNLVSHLKMNSDARFVTAEEYMNILMKRMPRPVLVDKDFRSHWVFKENGRFHPIREVPQDTVKAEVTERGPKFLRLRLTITTNNPIPELLVQFVNISQARTVRYLERKNEGTLMKKVNPGVHSFLCRQVIDQSEFY